MEDVVIGKRTKSSCKDRSRNYTKRPKLKRGSSSWRARGNVLSCLNETEKSFEKQMSRSHLTHGRITTRPGLFHQGKCTSFVQRALHLSPSKKARMDEDLHRIIQLANCIPVRDSLHKNVSEGMQDNSGNYGVSSKHCDEVENVDLSGDLGVMNEVFCLNKSQENTRNNKSSSSSNLASKSTNHLAHPQHQNLEAEDRKRRSHNKPMLSSTSSSSASSSDSSSVKPINYLEPSLEEYEEFSTTVTLPLNSKRIQLFSGRDYLKETREKIKMTVQQKQLSITHEDTVYTPGPRDGQSSQTEKSFSSDFPQMSTPCVFNQANATHTHSSLTGNQQSLSEISPFPCILSPKTTILNPIEYLKRVEQANKQRERVMVDSGHESGQSYGSSLVNSQDRTNLSHELQSNYNPFHNSMETDDYYVSSQKMTEKLLYQHSNRSFIDSPQAFKLREGNFRLPKRQSSYNSMNSCCQKDYLDNLFQQKAPFQEKHLDMEVEHNIPGLQYLMGVSEITQSSSCHGDCSDLLDELDALYCNPVTDTSLTACIVSKRQSVKKKQWAPPPTPPTPEHKFYRRKMF